MALKKPNIRFFLSLSLFLLALTSLFLDPISALALGDSAVLPTFTDFSHAIKNGQKDVLRGMYVDNILALPVVQQPAGNPAYVSNSDGKVTQFSMASQFGNIGLLAHNHLAGQSFSQLAVGQEIRLVYGNGHVETFVIKEVLKYQALQPTSVYSSFKNLDKDETLTVEQMFDRVYKGDRHLTLQTCITADGKLSWGRLFVIAVPKEKSLALTRLGQ
jgi:hypothetical protein